MIRWYWVFGAPVAMLLIIAFCYMISQSAKGAELPLEITEGRSHAQSMTLNKFGVYTPKYYERRWKKLCAGGGRYVAMAEAYDMKKPQPCTQ